jgi:hypothetical protein
VKKPKQYNVKQQEQYNVKQQEKYNVDAAGPGIHSKSEVCITDGRPAFLLTHVPVILGSRLMDATDLKVGDDVRPGHAEQGDVLALKVDDDGRPGQAEPGDILDQ